MNKGLAKKNNNLKVRIPMYFVGLFLMTIGIAISVKSNLGVSPVSSIPYTMTCVWGIEMGKATILFHTILVLIQIILLRRNFKPINLLQMPAGCAFCPRCDAAMKICLSEKPEELRISDTHLASCWMNIKELYEAQEEAE